MWDEHNDWVRCLIAVFVHFDSTTAMVLKVEFGKRDWR